MGQSFVIVLIVGHDDDQVPEVGEEYLNLHVNFAAFGVPARPNSRISSLTLRVGIGDTTQLEGATLFVCGLSKRDTGGAIS